MTITRHKNSLINTVRAASQPAIRSTPPKRVLAACFMTSRKGITTSIACITARCLGPIATGLRGLLGALGTPAISSLSLKSGGSGYTSVPSCTIAAPANKSEYLSPSGGVIYAGGTRATCTATIDATPPVVSGLTLTDAGEGYTGVPICTLSGGGGTGASQGVFPAHAMCKRNLRLEFRRAGWHCQ